MSQEHKSKVEIMQALKCCGINVDCGGCPYALPQKTWCIRELLCDALDLFEEEDRAIVHKTISAIKAKATRTSYADMAVPGVIHETYTIRGQDLDEIEKELTEVVK